MLQKTADAYSPELAARRKKIDVIFSICFIGVLIYSVLMIPYGISSSDESFYLTVPYRLAQGDCFFVDEWHVSQLTGFLLYPLMKLFLLFSPSTDGVYLVFRCFYVAAKALVGLYIYLRCRKISPTAALFSCFALMLYSPYSIRALSYNTMGIMFMALFTVTAATVGEKGRIDMFFAGLCLAAAVLCCPYLAMLFLIYVLFALALILREKRRGKAPLFDSFAFSPAGLLSMCGGVFTLFILFCCFLFSRAGIKDVIESIPYLFLDPEHIDPDPLWYIKNYFYCILYSSRLSFMLLALCAVNTVIMFADRGRMKRRPLYLTVAAVLSFLFGYPFLEVTGSNEFMLGINYLGFTAFCLSEKKEHRLFQLVFIPGLIYTACLHHASNQRFLGVCNAAAVCALASVFFICNVISEILVKREQGSFGTVTSRATALVLSCLLLFQLGVEAYMQTTTFYQDERLSQLDCKIDRGVQKGLIASEKDAQIYYDIWDDTQQIRREKDGYVLYVSYATWLPLGDTKRSASNSGWTYYDMAVESTDILARYLELHPEKYPDYIYVTEEFLYSYQPSVDGRPLMDMLNTAGRPVIKSSTGYIVK